eukprot:8070659-Ditylum_brightwellii.AAC.1
MPQDMKVPWTPTEGGHKRRPVTPLLLMIFPISFCPCCWSFLLNTTRRLQSNASCVSLQEPHPPIDPSEYSGAPPDSAQQQIPWHIMP